MKWGNLIQIKDLPDGFYWAYHGCGWYPVEITHYNNLKTGEPTCDISQIGCEYEVPPVGFLFDDPPQKIVHEPKVS